MEEQSFRTGSLLPHSRLLGYLPKPGLLTAKGWTFPRQEATGHELSVLVSDMVGIAGDHLPSWIRLCNGESRGKSGISASGVPGIHVIVYTWELSQGAV